MQWDQLLWGPPVDVGATGTADGVAWVYRQGVGSFLNDGNIALFSSHYFLKQPRTGMAVLWHQDGSYVKLAVAVAGGGCCCCCC